MPIARADGRIVLAMADPTDVERVTELRACTGHRIDVVTVTADALERALSRAYGTRAETPEPRPTRAETDEPTTPDSREGPRPGEPRGALAAVRARLDAVRELARSWERWGNSVDGLLGELRERRAEIARLAAELSESRAVQAETSRERDAKTEALTRLEAAYAHVVRDRDVLQGAFEELRQRHDALLRDRRFAIDRVEAALHRLRS
jgi:predicted RNase H-like nuclease (RuvC/YqgF family)